MVRLYWQGFVEEMKQLHGFEQSLEVPPLVGYPGPRLGEGVPLAQWQEGMIPVVKTL